MTHTPGPWTADDNFITTEDATIIAYLWGGKYEETCENHLVNGPLMAAAPDLLAALRNLADAAEQEHDESEKYEQGGDHFRYILAMAVTMQRIEEARAAIAKVEASSTTER